MQEQTSATPTSTETQEKKVAPSESFQQMRKMLEAERAEKERLKEEKERLEREFQKAKSLSSPTDDDSDEPYIDPKTFRKKMALFEESLEQKIEKKAEEKARALIDAEKRNDYLARNHDFNEIMQPEVLEKFIAEHPNIAAVMQKMPDTFERQQLVYETIKTMKSIKPAQSAKPEAPKSMLSQAFDARKAQMAYQPGGNSGGPFASLGDFSESGMKNAYQRFKALQKTVNV